MTTILKLIGFFLLFALLTDAATAAWVMACAGAVGVIALVVRVVPASSWRRWLHLDSRA